MGRGSIIGKAVLVVVTFGGLNMGGPAGAQESTPAAGEINVEIATGVTFDLVPASEDPPALYRLSFAPGATLHFAGDPAISLVYVETGAIALDMDAAVSDARSGTPTAGDDDDAAIAVRQGDFFVLPPLVAGEIRNERQRPASIVIAAITPGMFPATVAGTPAAG